MDTIKALERCYQILGGTIFLSSLLLLFSGFSFLIIKKLENRVLTVFYGVLMFFSLLIFSGIAYSGPLLKDIVSQQLSYQCAKENQTSADLPKVDLFYSAGNA